MSKAPTAGSPLSGKTVVVTRPVHQGHELSQLLEAAGADVLLLPMISIADPADGGAALRGAVERIEDYDWVVFTSANGVDSFFGALDAHSSDRTKIACVGVATASAVEAFGKHVDLVPEDHVSEALVEAFPIGNDGGAVLLPSAAVTRDVVAPGLRAKGWLVDEVEAYRTVACDVSSGDAGRALSADVVTFTSPATVEQFVSAVGRPGAQQIVASIGPVTSARLRGLDLEVTVEAEPHTVVGLTSALTAHFG